MVRLQQPPQINCYDSQYLGNAAVLALLRAGSISGEDVVGTLIAVSEVAAEKMGGTSGALYS